MCEWAIEQVCFTLFPADPHMLWKSKEREGKRERGRCSGREVFLGEAMLELRLKERARFRETLRRNASRGRQAGHT